MADLVSNVLATLATCLCAQITTDGGPEPCFCGVVPGDAVVQDYAGNCVDLCGMAWVRLVSLYPASGVGFIDENAGNCASELGLEIEIGLMRCAEMPDDRGNPPTDAALLRSVELQTAGALTMRRAILCCPSLSPKDYKLGPYAPAGPMGGLVGGTWQLSLVV